MSFDPAKTERIANWRQSQLSIARFYGSIRIQGVTYVICPVTDNLVREDVFKAEKKDAKKRDRIAKAEKKQWEDIAQLNLLESQRNKGE